MRLMLLFHPGLLICLVTISAAWPLGFAPAVACAAVLVAGYAYVVLFPLRTSRFTGRPRRVATTVALLGSLVVTLCLFLLIMDRWDAGWLVRWPLALIAAYYAGAMVTTLVLMGTPRGGATRT